MVAIDSSAQPLALQETVDELKSQLESVTSDRDYYKEQYSKLSSDNYDLRTALKVLIRTPL